MYAEMPLWAKGRKFARLLLRKTCFPPNDICIEISTTCRHRCGACFRFPLHLKEELMPLETYRVVLEEVRKATRGKIDYLTFVGLGEIFCHDRLFDILAFTKALLPHTRLNISSSLLHIDTDVLASIVKKELVSMVSVSVDDTQPPGSFFHIFSDELERNIDMLMRMRPDRGSGPELRLQSIIISRNQIERMIDFAERKGFEILSLIRLDLHAFQERPAVGRPTYQEEKKLMKHARRYARLKKIQIWNNNDHDVFMRIASLGDRRCLLVDDHMFVDVYGNVLPCFFLREHVFGNLLQESLRQIYQKKKKKQFYRDQLRLCRGCDVYKRGSGPQAWCRVR